jgi:AraC-like DNA-binding protein
MSKKGSERSYDATVSLAFVQDWLVSLRSHCSTGQYAIFLKQAGFPQDVIQQLNTRVTRDQIVKLYQIVASTTGDEMMGLWTRPIRSGALEILCTTMIEASSIRTAVHRFTRFWNLVLDDFNLQMLEENDSITVQLIPSRTANTTHRFGHALLLKLTHGLASWLANRELALQHVGFAFPRPPFAEDYSILFPASIGFGEVYSSIRLARKAGALRIERRISDVSDFLIRAPRDWIFTSFDEHALQLKIRELLSSSPRTDCTLEQAANAVNMSPRTLIRKLAADNLSFQDIKDGFRRDLAIRELTRASKSLDDISYEMGFSSSTVFHRAFKKWTGVTPSTYREKLQQW